MNHSRTVGTVVEHLLDDDDVYEYLSTAATNLRAARARARRKGAEAAVDEHVYGQLGRAGTALRAAVASALGQPELPRQRVGGIGSVLLLGAGAALVVIALRAASRP